MPAAEKLDLYKKHRAEYVTPRKPQIVKIKPAQYLSVTGKGEPGGEAFQKQVGALYGAAFTIKMKKKFAGRDYKVCRLEALWWGQRKKAWSWKLLLRVPGFITRKDLAAAVKALLDNGKQREVAEVKLETLKEGTCVQMLHVGPYEAEDASIAQMMALAKEHGLSFRGIHHEIYLSDPRRVPPARLRTILRQPVG